MQRGVEIRHGLRPDRTRKGGSLLITKAIGDTGRSFVRNLACGVCDQSNLRINLRRGRSPSGCNHSLQTCPANGVRSLPGRPFSNIFPACLRLAPKGAGFAPAQILLPDEYSMHQNRCGRLAVSHSAPDSIPTKFPIQFTKRRIRMFMTMPNARNVNKIDDPP